MKLKLFPPPFQHQHTLVLNVNDLVEEKLTYGNKVAGRFAIVMGSWRFIIIQSCILLLWIFLNIAGFIMHWDPYPFILMNLVLSLQAAYAAPIIMMSQNRQAAKDRIEAHNDYLLNRKSEEEVRVILEHLDAQNKALERIIDMLVHKERNNKCR